MEFYGPCRALLNACPAFDTILQMNRIGFTVRHRVDLAGTDLDTVLASITAFVIDDRIHRRDSGSSDHHVTESSRA
jgi:hypothetical protein